MRTKWQKKWGYEVRKTTFAGVYDIKDGRVLVRSQIKDQSSGISKDIIKVLEQVTPAEAALWKEREKKHVLEGETTTVGLPSRRRFDEYAAATFERKVQLGEINGVANRSNWEVILRLHLIPVFGDFFIDELTSHKSDFLQWQADVGQRIRSGQLAHSTANGWLAKLKVIVNAAVEEFDLPRSPVASLKPFVNKEHHTYTIEEPNALRPDMVVAFVQAALVKKPRHYAMLLLMFVTGLRPSMLRPLRRRGPIADIKWKEGLLLVRQSHTGEDEVLDDTKTGLHQQLGLPRQMIDVLNWHVGMFKIHRLASDLLFPGKTDGAFLARSVLDEPIRTIIAAVNAAHKLDSVKHPVTIPFAKFTPRGLRRTFQDLCRHLGIDPVVQRAICGHAPPGVAISPMTALYSTVGVEETRKAIGRLYAFVTTGEIGAGAKGLDFAAMVASGAIPRDEDDGVDESITATSEGSGAPA